MSDETQDLGTIQIMKESHMGTKAANILTVGTTSPVEDAFLLAELFPQVEVESANQSRVVVFPSGLVVLLVSALQSASVSWVVESSAFLDKCKPHAALSRGVLCGIAFVQIMLPGGGSLLLVPPEMVTTPAGRRKVAIKLATEHPEKSEVSSSTKSPRKEMPNMQMPSGPEIPSLDVKLLDGNLTSTLPLNTQKPIQVETDLFKGEMLFLVRPTDPTVDPYWNERIFSKKKRRLIVQIQGKFLREPKGIVYAGAEVSDPMKLGLVTKGVCSILLRLVESFNSNVHYSYGDSSEKAHIVVPAFTFFERIVTSPPGETPPQIGEPFEESKESRNYRKVSKSFGKWNTTDTYSLEFYSMYIDLTTWTLINLPVSGDIALKTFWGNSLLRICMYEKLPDETKAKDKKHSENLKKYVFGVQVEFLGETGRTKTGEEDDTASDNILRWSGSHPVSFVRQPSSTKGLKMTRSESNVFEHGDLELMEADEETDDYFFFDAEEANVDESEFITQNLGEISREGRLLGKIDDTCPALIEVCSSRGGYSKAFVIVNQNKVTVWPAQACEDLIHGSKRIKTTITESFSQRMSSTERTRRALGLAFAETSPTDIPREKLKAFLATRGLSAESVFLRRHDPAMADKQQMSTLAASFVARAISDRHWIEEWVRITPRRIMFYHPDKRQPHYHVLCTNVFDVEPLPQELCPTFPGYYFLVFRTVGRSIYLMFRDEVKRDNWLGILREVTSKRQANDVDSSSCSNDSTSIGFLGQLLGELDNPADEFMHKSSMWSCKNRRVLNCGLFSFHNRTAGLQKPLDMVEQSLRGVLSLPQDSGNDLQARHSFFDSAAALKDAVVEGLSENEKLVFFLNLYHTMISHAFLVLGPPNSSLQWISYFNSIAYQVGDDVFSLTELEHSVIRKRMSPPSQFLSRFAIPKSSYPRIELMREPDFRVNFALNCGSVSNPATVFVYRHDSLDKQLDAATRMYLSETASTVVRKKDEVVITLPRICQWYRSDFGNGSDLDLIEKVKEYLRDQAVLRGDGFVTKWVTIRYQAFSFECRSLKLMR